MAAVPYLVPTVRYRRASKTGSRINFITEDPPLDLGKITDIFWSTDVGGSMRISSVHANTDCYLQIRTSAVTTTVTISISTNADETEVLVGRTDGAYAVAISGNRAAVPYKISQYGRTLSPTGFYKTQQFIGTTLQVVY